jgi:hypothetical protein
MMAFLAVLTVGFIYEWMKGALEWGVKETALRPAPQVGPVPPGPEQDLLLRAATEEIQDRGFITSTVDALVDWARSGSLVADDLRPGVLAPSR